MNLARPAGFVLLAAVISKCVCLASDAASQNASNLLAHAASQQNIREKGAQPFQLHMRIHAEHVVAKPMDGAYAEIWLSPEKWRREIAFPGLEVRCAEILGKERRPSRELCFDATGSLAMESIGEQRFEYGDFDKFNGKIFPKSIRVYQGDSKLLEINADSLSSPPDRRPEVFQHEPGARQMAPCERWPSDLAKKVPPQYPHDARNLHQQGSVTLYALVSADGTVNKTAVLVSAGSSLDQSASDAVKQWAYPPAACGAIPLQTEIEVQVNYRLTP